MAAHEIGHHKLLFSQPFVEMLVLGKKPPVHLVGGLAHHVQHRVGDVLRRHLQLAGDMVLHQLPQEGAVLVAEQVVEADAAADEHLLHPRQAAELAQQLQVIPVVHRQVFAGGGEQALAVGAHALCQLLLAAGMAEVGGGAADIVDIALEVRVLDQQFGFFNDGLVAAGLDDAALVEGQGAEAASAEAPPVGGEAELDLLNGRDAPQLFVRGVIRPHIGQGVHMVHLRRGQGLLGRVLHHVAALRLVGFHQPLGHEGIRVAVLGVKALGVSAAAFVQRLPGGEGQGVVHTFQGPGLVHGAPDISDIGDGKAAVQGLRHFHDAALAHAVQQQVRLGIQQQGTLQAVRPVVVVGQSAEAGFNAAHDDGLVGEAAADEVAVHHRGVVRPLAGDAAGGEGVGPAALFGHGVVVHHGVHVAAHDQKGQTGLPQRQNAAGVLPVRLGDDAHLVAGVLQHPGDDGVAKGGVVHVGVADDIDKITLLPAPAVHVRPGDGQKISFHKGSPLL